MAASDRPKSGDFPRLKLVGQILLAVFLLWYAASKGDRALFRLGLRTAEAVYGSVETRYEGKAVFLRNEHVVYAPLPGRVTLLVGEGRHVRTGDVIVELSETSQAARSLGQVEEINRRLAQTGTALAAERGRLLLLRQEVQRRLSDARQVLSEALAKGETEAARDAESRRQAIERELAGIDQALADLDRMEEQERRELLSQREALLSLRPGDRTLVRSPSAGMISFAIDGLEDEFIPGANPATLFAKKAGREQRLADGARVERGDPLFRVVETARVEVAIRVKGTALAPGTRVILDFRSIPERSFSGRLVESTTVDGEFYGRVELDAFDFSLIHRREADVILTTERREGIVVPRSAIVEERGKKGVYILAGDTPVFREVRVLGANERQAVVDGVVGVPVGARVVVNPSRLRTR